MPGKRRCLNGSARREDPVYDRINPTKQRGIHNVRDEFFFKANPGFIFHDSPGFEAEGKEELKAMMSLIEDEAKSQEVRDQIHVIWFCFGPDVSCPLFKLEKKFFKKQWPGNGNLISGSKVFIATDWMQFQLWQS